MAVAEAPPLTLYDQAKDRRLSQIYAPVFTLILQLRASHEFGDADVLRRRIKDLLDRAEREALRTGLPSEEARSAKFALVAFIDETILSSDWSQKERWVAKPLQLEFYDRYDAGEIFFDRLEEMLRQPAQQAEVLEVYYLCMTLGFKGRYLLHDQERLRMLIEETYAALSRVPGLVGDVLSPHGRPRGQVATEVQSKLPVWAIVVFAAVIALLVYLGLSLYISSAASDAARAIDAVPRAESTR
jgi:type VI secretion system protein ImpK